MDTLTHAETHIHTQQWNNAVIKNPCRSSRCGSGSNEPNWHPWGCQSDPWPPSVGSGSGIAVTYGVGCRCGSDPTLLWLWHRVAAAALIQPLAWEPPYVTGAALKKKKKIILAPCILSHLNFHQILYLYHWDLYSPVKILAFIFQISFTFLSLVPWCFQAIVCF